MLTLADTKSLHSRLVQSIISFTLLMFFIISIIVITMVNKYETKYIANEATAWANILAKSSSPFLENDNKHSPNSLSNALKKNITTPLINRIHIYRLNKDKTIEYVSNYRKNYNFSPINDKISEIAQLSTIKYNRDHLALIVNITQKKQLLGYLYIEFSLLEKQKLVRHLIYILLIALFFILIFAFILVQWLFNKTNRPMTKLSEEIRAISQNKHYQIKVSTSSYKELNLLIKNINILLTHTDKHVTKVMDEHQHALGQNEVLEARLTARTNALKESNDELLSTLEKLHEFQEQLVETEKMASLGDIVAGIAHEVNTPIGLGITASSILSDNLNELKAHFENKTLKSSELKKFLSDGVENISIVFRNLDRAAQLVSNFKKVSINHANTESHQFNILNVLNEVLLTLSTKIEANDITVSINCPDDLIINSKAEPIKQIFTNLIDNSIYHAFNEIKHRKIIINIIIFSGQLSINYQDNGQGIDNSIKDKVFSPFTTTKRGNGGSGLGMHLVYNLVTQALNGHIILDDKPKQGVSFDITFPVIK